MPTRIGHWSSRLRYLSASRCMMVMTRETFAEQGKYPLNKLSYDLVCLIYEKSKGLEALDRYLYDAQGEPELVRLFHRIRHQEGELIAELQKHLAERIMVGQEWDIRFVNFEARD